MGIDTVETIVCRCCGAVNRAACERLTSGARPTCGSCRQRLFTGEPQEISSERELEKILAETSIPVLVDFWATWCGPCRAMAPQFRKAAELLEPRVRLVKVDIDTLPNVASRHGIRSVPTLILFAHGAELSRKSGVLEAGSLAQWLHASDAECQAGRR